MIYGFNNGGSEDWWRAVLIAEDGTGLGSHICSAEAYMPHDLGVLDGSMPNRHLGFREHYPGGYRMDFVKGCDVLAHPGLSVAYKKNLEKAAIDARPRTDISGRGRLPRSPRRLQCGSPSNGTGLVGRPGNASPSPETSAVARSSKPLPA